MVAETWGMKLRTTREIPHGGEPDVKLPTSFSPEDVQKYIEDKTFVGGNGTVIDINWCLVVKIGNEIVKANIPVWIILT